MMELVMVGSCILGERRGRGTGKAMKKLSRPQGRAAARLSEMATLASWRARNGIISEPAGWATAAANALSFLDGTPPWALSPEGVRGQLPPGLTLDEEETLSVLERERAHGSRYPLTGGEAGRLLGLTLFELTELQGETGKAISTLEPYDETPAERALRRAERDRKNGRRWSKNYRDRKKARAKSLTRDVTNRDVTNSDVTNYVRPLYIRDPDAPPVTNPGSTREAVMAAVAAGAATNPAIVDRTGLPPATVRKTLQRLVDDGRLTRPDRGIYALVGERGAEAPAPRLTREDDEWGYRVMASEMSRAMSEAGLDRTIDPSDPSYDWRPNSITRPQPEARPDYDEFGDPIPPSDDFQHPNPVTRSQAGRLKRTRHEREDLP